MTTKTICFNIGRQPAGGDKANQTVKHLAGGKCFIDASEIECCLQANVKPDPARIRDILQKSLVIQTLSAAETACLLNVSDPGLWDEMAAVAAMVKKKVYDNRIVTFAPLYCGNLCVNDCQYCGFRRSNAPIKRKILTMEEIRKEAEILAGTIGHKRLILVAGEHPRTGADYIAETIRTIMGVKVKTRGGLGQIRRCNVNAAPMTVEDLKILRDAGIGTYQVFQETYHPETYSRLHPKGTIKADYLWRLYAMHRAMEAGCDDVGIGALFGLYDWKFEVMGLLCHAVELEHKFGVGPHTISFPRLEPADNTPISRNSRHKVSDADFRKLVTVIRLAVPYTGMILTARENAEMRKQILPLGCTQTDASTRIGVGANTDMKKEQQGNRQQFMLGDTRSLDAVVRELAEAGYITSFCTAGYRCGRTGRKIMTLLRSGKEGIFCKLNAVLTFREWLDDFASAATLAAGEKIIAAEIDEIKMKLPEIYPQFAGFYNKVKGGTRDIYF
jgi:2-iminoacetate synthase